MINEEALLLNQQNSLKLFTSIRLLQSYISQEALARTMSQTSQKSATELSDFTLALIKPDAVKAGFVADIISELNDNGFFVA